jgi:hypothetical protein
MSALITNTVVGGGLPTFRLFVKYPRPLVSEQDEAELRGLFEACAQVTRFTTRLGAWRNCIVTFSSTGEAKRARNALQNTQFQGQPLDMQFALPTRRVVVRGLPRGVSFALVAEVFQLHRKIVIEHDDTWRGNEDIALCFDRVDDATAFVANNVARDVAFEGQTLSFDFGKEDTNDSGGVGGGVGRGGASGVGRGGSRDGTRDGHQNEKRGANGNNIGMGKRHDNYDGDGARPVRKMHTNYRNDRDRQGGRSFSEDFDRRNVASSRSRSRSRSPTPERKRGRSSSQSKKIDSPELDVGGDRGNVSLGQGQKKSNNVNQGSWSPSRSYDEDFEDVLGYKGPPKELLDHISPAVGVVVNSVESNAVGAPSNIELQMLPNQVPQTEVEGAMEIEEKQVPQTVVENDQVVMEIDENPAQIVDENGEEHHHQDANQPCVECVRLLGELKGHVSEHHSNGPNEVQKAVIKTWFECHYVRKEDANIVGDDAGEIPVAVSRMTLLGEINAFLDSMGWPKWKTQSALYKDWFLREVMGLSDNDIRKGRHWSLFYKDGFAPGGNGDYARNRQQRMEEMFAKIRTYMNIE